MEYSLKSACPPLLTPKIAITNKIGMFGNYKSIWATYWFRDESVDICRMSVDNFY